ncbi:hypothetical protein QQP08_004800 [Theobroma cacao]|nr:hypothetical protein QQP08_004800 [Theobroma cacao]
MIVSKNVHIYNLRVCDRQGEFEDISWFGSGFNLFIKIMELINHLPVESNCTIGNRNPGVENNPVACWSATDSSFCKYSWCWLTQVRLSAKRKCFAKCIYICSVAFCMLGQPPVIFTRQNQVRLRGMSHSKRPNLYDRVWLESISIVLDNLIPLSLENICKAPSDEPLGQVYFRYLKTWFYQYNIHPPIILEFFLLSFS